MNKESIRSQRLQILLRMAVAGKSYSEIYNKAMSWGISEPTAKSYMKSLSAYVSRTGTNLVEDYAGKPNPYDSDEIIVGRGSDIIR